VTTPANALPAYLTTATMSRSATEAAGPALLVVSIATIGNATTGSYIVASLTASAAIGGPVVGALIDRARSPRRGFALAMAVMAIGLAAIALTIGHVPVPLVMGLAVVAGLGYPALTGAWSAQLPRLVPADRLQKAYASDAATYSVAAVVAPPLATALVALSATAPLWVPVALLLACIALLRIVPLTERDDVEHRATLSQDLKEGLGAIVGLAGLRRTAIITTVGFAGQAAIFVAAPILAQSVGGSLGFTGVILGVFAIGGVTTAAWFARRPVQRPDRAIIVSTALSALALVAVGLAPTPGLLLVAAFLMGATEPPLVSAMFQVRVRESPPRVQAQVFTTSASLRMTAFAVATATCGWLLGWGVGAVIAFGVALHVVSLVLGIALGPTLPPRRHWWRRD
jgi:MFS family permease